MHWKNNLGQTALIEAALWGRLDTVKSFQSCLDERDVHTRDANGMRAIDLAASTPSNIKELSRRSGWNQSKRFDERPRYAEICGS